MYQYELDNKLFILSMEGRSCVLQVFLKGAKRVLEVAYHFDFDKRLSIQTGITNPFSLAAIAYKGKAFQRIAQASSEIAFVALKEHFDKRIANRKKE